MGKCLNSANQLTSCSVSWLVVTGVAACASLAKAEEDKLGTWSISAWVLGAKA